MCRFRVGAILIFIFSLMFCPCQPKQINDEISALITTTTGVLKGKLVKVDDHEVFAFLGIPYAEPPTEHNRFKKPIAIKPWQGVFDASTKPTPCMQTKIKDFAWIAKRKTSEDCLYLNLWVPKRVCNLISGSIYTSPNNLPIMIWIYGGGFWSGSSALDLYDGAVLADQGDVIVASMNYRVGPFGFLYSGTPDAPGNMGLHDQKMAIEWIKTNAKAFCGNPDSITLFGESAGAYSVGFHLISPMTRDLFKRAIMESGTPYNPTFGLNPELVKLKNNKFATALGCANETVNLSTDPKTVVDCMVNLNASDIVGAESVILEKSPLSFYPTYGDDFLPENPIHAINSGDFKHTEILLGNNKEEGTIFLNYIMPNIFTQQLAPDLPIPQARKIIEAIFQESVMPTGEQVADFYLSNVTDENPKAILKAIYDSLGDFLFVCPSVLYAEKAAQQNDVYFYFFTHRSSQSIWGDWVGVPHMEEIPFVFGAPLKKKSSYTEEESKFSFDLIKTWTSFVREGKPESTSVAVWPTYSATEHQYIELNPKNYKIGEGPHLKNCNFWRNYFSQM